MYKLEELVYKQTSEKILIHQKSDKIIIKGFIDKSSSIKDIETIVFKETNSTIINNLSINANTLLKEKHQLIKYFRAKIYKTNKAISYLRDDFNKSSNIQKKRITLLEDRLNSIKTKTNKEVESFYKERDEVYKEIKFKLSKVFGVDSYFNPKTLSLDFGKIVIFEVGEYQYSPEAMATINEEFRKYIKVLIPYKSYIQDVIILGYADNRGVYTKNLKLSQQRALEIKNTLIYMDLVKHNGMDKLLKIKGIVGKNEKLSSRKIKIKFVLKSSKFLNSIKRILND